MEKLSHDSWLELVEASCLEKPSIELRERILPNLQSVETSSVESIQSIMEAICREVASSLCDVSSRISLQEKDLLIMAFQCQSADQFADFFYRRCGVPCPARLKIYWYLFHLEIPISTAGHLRIRLLALLIKNYLEGGKKEQVTAEPPTPTPSPQSVSLPQKRRPDTKRDRPESFDHKVGLSQYIKDLSQGVLPPADALADLESIFDANREAPIFDEVFLSQTFATLAKLQKKLSNAHSNTRAFAQKLIEELPRFAASLSVRSVSDVLHALVTLGQKEIGNILPDLLRRSDHEIKNSKNIDLVKIVWSCAVLEFLDFTLLDPYISEIENRLHDNPQDFFPLDVQQLYHFFLDTGKIPGIKQIYEDNEADGNGVNNTYTLSDTDRRVEGIIKTLLPPGTTWKIYTSQKIHGFELDIVIERSKTIRSGRSRRIKKQMTFRINIEVDGSSHELSFLTDAFRDRVLKKHGFQDVIRIPVLRSMSDDQIVDVVKEKLRGVKIGPSFLIVQEIPDMIS